MGDVHLRRDTPVCRTDDFLSAQFKKLSFIKSLQKKHDCPILCSGDLFNKAIPSLYFMGLIYLALPNNFYTIYGNHDLPNHSLKEAEKCGVYHLAMIRKLNLLSGTHFGQKPEKPTFEIKGKKILVWHVMTYKTELPYPGCKAPKARSILHKYPEYDLILTGDNHQPFIQKYSGRLLVNPGSMMRQEADQMDYKPAVWLWYANTNTVEPVYLPIDKKAVTREHLEVVKERENRITAFIEHLNIEGLDFISFEKNIEKLFQTKKVKSKVKEIVYKLIG